MRNVMLAVLVLVSVFSASAQAQEDGKSVLALTADLRSGVWFDVGYAKPMPTTLKAAIAAEKELLGADNRFWKPVNAQGLQKVCSAFKAVQLSCDYNTRVVVSMFLAVNGKGLFPAAGGTNPYYTAAEREREVKMGTDTSPDDAFIGHPPQNDMLAAAVLKNAKLFQNGDLTAEAVKNSWR
jgi:hypothetical protein